MLFLLLLSLVSSDRVRKNVLKEDNRPQHNVQCDQNGECHRENAISENAIGENAIGENAIGENAIGENAIGENAIGENAISENAISENEKGVRSKSGFYENQKVRKNGKIGLENNSIDEGNGEVVSSETVLKEDNRPQFNVQCDQNGK